jgi:hypothetical protein
MARETFAEACAAVEAALAADTRQAIAADLAQAPTLGQALIRLRDGLRANGLNAAGHRLSFDWFVAPYDRATRREGFHVLNDWDGKSDRVNEDSIPVDVLNYLASLRGDDGADPLPIAVLIDYYFVHILELLALRIWDEGNADENLERVDALLGALQGPAGSGQPFAADAATLLLLATSHFELREEGYARLLERVRTLDRRHQAAIAMSHAASMGSHLRFGFEATYARDTLVMRDDNVADYPWLCYALLTLIREYAALGEGGASDGHRERIVEALLNGLSADARAFVGAPPKVLSAHERDRAEFAERFDAHRDELLAGFELFRPTEQAYSPLSFFFNFAHNVRKGTVVDTLLRGEVWPLTFNDLLTALPRDGRQSPRKELLANTLMTYARLNPDRIRGRLMPVIVYDPMAGRQAFGTMMRRLREA